MNVNIGDGADIDAQLLMTGRGCIIGQSGSGKSYLVGVIVEELCRLSLPFVIVDTEGEYASLKETFKAIWASQNEKADVSLDIDMAELFQKSIDGSIPIVFDVSEVADKVGTVYRALSALYSIEEVRRTPFLVIIEEADKFAPQVVHPGVNMVEELSVRGRKRGIGLLVATQRPANISKNVLAQCGFGLIGKLSIENDIQAVSILFDDKKTLSAIPSLRTGSFMPFGLPYSNPVKVKPRTVQHIGSTPLLKSGYATSELSTVLAELKGEGKASRLVSSRQGQQKKASGTKRISVEILPRKISPSTAAAIAERLARKTLLLVGPRAEVIERVEPRLMGALLCTLRVPTKRVGEFIEGSAIVCNDSFVSVNGKLVFSKAVKGKPIKLTPNEDAVISSLIKAGNADDLRLSKMTGLSEQAVLRASYRLRRAGIVAENNGKLSISQKPKRLLGSSPELEKLSAEEDIMPERAADKKSASLLLSNAIPGSEIVEMREIYLPVYEVSYRRGNNVRIMLIDGISGRPMAPSH